VVVLEIVGVVSASAGLAQICLHLIRDVKSHVRAFKDAPEEILLLHYEMVNIEELVAVLVGLKVPGTFQGSAASLPKGLQSPLGRMEHCMEEINEKLEKQKWIWQNDPAVSAAGNPPPPQDLGRTDWLKEKGRLLKESASSTSRRSQWTFDQRKEVPEYRKKLENEKTSVGTSLQTQV